MSAPALAWIVDDDRSIRWVLERALAQAGFDTRSFEGAADVLERAAREAPDVIVSDIRMPGIDGLDLLVRLKALRPEVPVIIMTAHSDLDAAVASYQRGAFEYLPKPFDVDEAVSVVRRAVLLAEERRALVEPKPRQAEPAIIGKAPAMQEVFRAIGRLSHSHVTVLINGESGTGKELVARALHRHSPRAGGPFIALNMAAIPRELIESELFGHEKGAFTGAAQQRIGRFEQADGGTLFLDEIGDMPAEAQTRLLRVLAESEFHRVGGSQPIRTDVRIIAATHQDLESLVSAGRFREDLYHRLNVIRVHLPPLRDRRSDVPLLARHFLAQAAAELNEQPKALRPEAEAFLSQLPWPGNVRQLENTCRWLTVMAAGREVHVGDLPPELRAVARAEGQRGGSHWEEALTAWADAELAAWRDGAEPLLDRAVPRFEQIMIERALAHTGGRRREASIVLGWGRNTLTRKIKELGLHFVPGDDAGGADDDALDDDAPGG
jgi:two-component system nitrogen regulation response regulator GlnG